MSGRGGGRVFQKNLENETSAWLEPGWVEGPCDGEAAEGVSLAQVGLKNSERGLELCLVCEGAARGFLATVG